jgi:hypothetical protein
MNTFELIKTVTKLGGAALSGEATAFIGAIGAFLGESAANVVKNIADYVYFDAENGYLKDNPGKENESVVKRSWEVIK